uniref:Uncharacterized protein n=1 Tax=Arundo donax TaxID=35708 RepID=A0A0A9CVC5_ARUDO
MFFFVCVLLQLNLLWHAEPRVRSISHISHLCIRQQGPLKVLIATR